MYLQFLLALFMSRYHMGATENFARPNELALFLNRIGRVHRLHAITIVHSLGSVDPSYLDALHCGLMCNSSNHFYLLPQMTATDKDSTHARFGSLQHEKAIYLVFARNSKDAVVQLQAEKARGRRYTKTMFLLKKQESQKDIKYFFELLWKLQFRSALVVVAAKYFYRMDPYPTIRVIRMRRLSTYDPDHIFPPPNRKNLRGYRIRLPVQQDVPNTFWYKNRRTKALELAGLGGILINNLMKHLNVTMDLFSFEVNGSRLLNMAALTDLIVEGKVELSPHLYTTLQANSKVDYSYPTQVAPRCFMIPLNNEISRSLYVFLPFTLPLWLCLLIALLVVHFLYVRRLMPDGHFWAILGVPGADPVRYGSCKPGRSLCNFLILGGIFILVQTYSTKLTSFLTVTLIRRPVGSLDELLLLPYRILVLPTDAYAIVGSLGHAEQFRTQFSFTDAENFSHKRISMDADYIYPISTIRWRFFDMQQRFLRKKRFYFSTICHGSFPYQYQLRVDSHLKDALHRFLLHVQQAGLHDLWLETCHRKAHRMGYLKDFSTLAELEEKLRLRPLALNLLMPAFSLFLCGLLGSGIAFLVEIRHSFGCRQKPPPINRNPRE
ncbi:uncharacterized protein LOC26526756 [Drosophila erecta]|uniref:Ionotropic glutamate receptor C-terminal domain-containing protein n=1 Tax=Drosophila erecta TaxID=7220 RepID=A0A0Q5U2L7_DROER|nr:uncharacterized protein LOC26526756 [Drosophila erecta]KQS43083.1 uncharacterized protein Dere_GG26932 [Drosophila erecta]